MDSLLSLPLSLLCRVLFPSAESRSSWLPKESVNNLFGWLLLQITLSLTLQCLPVVSLSGAVSARCRDKRPPHCNQNTQ